MSKRLTTMVDTSPTSVGDGIIRNLDDLPARPFLRLTAMVIVMSKIVTGAMKELFNKDRHPPAAES